jgi:hypothetical protein
VEMMDIQFAKRWFDESVELMIALRKNLESHPKDEPDALKRALIHASRNAVEALLKTSIQAALAITDQWSLESCLLMGHAQDSTALRRAETLYVVERNKTLRLFEQTAPNNLEPIPDDIKAEINELRAKR